MLQVVFGFSSDDQLVKKTIWGFFLLFIFFSAILDKVFYLFLVQSTWERVRIGKRHSCETSPRIKMKRQMGTVTLSIPLLRALVKKDIFVNFFSAKCKRYMS